MEDELYDSSSALSGGVWVTCKVRRNLGIIVGETTR